MVERDEDGITLYFFNTGYRKHARVNSADQVRWLFDQEKPQVFLPAKKKRAKQ